MLLFMHVIIIIHVLGMFLFNLVLAVKLFDSQASHYFVSVYFSKYFYIALGAIDHPLMVKVVD